jgi:hypothetical protein
MRSHTEGQARRESKEVDFTVTKFELLCKTQTESLNG